MTATEHQHEWYVACRGCDAEPDVAGHYVTFTATGWSIEHSHQCRMDGEMQRGCRFQAAVTELGDLSDDPDTFGRWRITDIDSEGLPSLERAEADA